ncbi:hypothetical protein RESH_04246 [Rhodopirellula europaea SH398]|uniref:Uncharacterized protein n=1 Tax=Rhodopirellula europaea SH398 TaxID=1263868 RepID=M5S103_9BACT|nr:hypothetical protein RESH_04246 [Rhodopirellula europaea SH398]
MVNRDRPGSTPIEPLNANLGEIEWLFPTIICLGPRRGLGAY